MISIVIPTYNEEKYLPLLLDSIKKQSFKDYEIIIADNNSCDNTKNVAKRYNCKIIEGGSPAKARDNGGLAAKHDILFLDADVILPKKFLTRFMNKIKKENLDIASCLVKPISSRISHQIFYSLKNTANYLFQYIHPHGQGQCIYCKKKIFEKTRFNRNLKHADEHDFVFRASKIGRFHLMKDIHVMNYPRRLEKEGTLKLFFKTIYPELILLLDPNNEKQLIPYEWGKHR